MITILTKTGYLPYPLKQNACYSHWSGRLPFYITAVGDRNVTYRTVAEGDPRFTQYTIAVADRGVTYYVIARGGQ